MEAEGTRVTGGSHGRGPSPFWRRCTGPLGVQEPLPEGLRVEQVDAWVQPWLLHSRLCGLGKVSPSTTLTPHRCWKDLVKTTKSSGSQLEGAGPPHTHCLRLVPEAIRGQRALLGSTLDPRPAFWADEQGARFPGPLRPARTSPRFLLGRHSTHPASPRPEATLFSRQHCTHVTGEGTEGQITFQAGSLFSKCSNSTCPRPRAEAETGR